MPGDLCESQRTGQGGRLGHRRAVDTGGPSAVRAHHGATLRRRESATLGDDQGLQRGFGTARVYRGGTVGRCDLADTAFANQLRAAVERTLDSGHRLDREAALWTPGRRGERLQPWQTRSALARVSHLFCGQCSAGAGGGSAGWQSDGVVLRTTGVLEIYRQFARRGATG